MPLQNHSKFCILKITLTILGETHSQIEHFVTVVLGRNSFTSQRSWSTDTQLQFILQKSQNCCVLVETALPLKDLGQQTKNWFIL